MAIKAKAAGAACSVMAIIALVLSQHGDEIKTSRAGLELIGNAESCQREPYMCPAAVLTVGIGSTGADIQPGRIYSDAEIAARWVRDIQGAERCIDRWRVPVAQPTYDALVSWVFNVGCGTAGGSTLVRKLRAGDIAGACNELPRWVYAGKRKLPGLVTRRTKEQALCLSGL